MIGRSNETSNIVNMAVLPNGPGDSMTVNEKMPTINNSKY